MKTSLTIFVSALLSLSLKASDAIPPEHLEFFENKIRPALSKYCYECHSEESGKTRGGLVVDTKNGLLQGGDTGPALEPDDLMKSLLWDAVSWGDPDFEMPPKEKMPESVIEDFRKWLQMGAPDPRVKETIIVENTIDLEEGRKHWAFQPLRRIPEFSQEAPIDHFVNAKLESDELKPVEPANPATLLRRLNFDLIGLPPLPAELTEFQSAWKEDPESALTAKIDELLARPQFGERWGRHWLDVARYAESTGQEVNYTYPNAWRYRDYVIDSFNADKPYDQFLQEQIAGDLLPTPSDEKWQENLIATGFLAMGPKGLNESNPRKFKMDVVDEQIDTMSRAVLGLTVACARCHDHKYDPIPTADYYALAGIFQSTDTFYGTQTAVQNKRGSDLILLPIADRIPTGVSYTPDEVAELEAGLADTRSQRRQFRGGGSTGGASAQQMQIRLGMLVSQYTQKLNSVNKDGTPKTMAMGVQDASSVGDAPILERGEVEKPAQLVDRGFLSVMNFAEPVSIRDGQSGRRELAEWLTSVKNPLTPRVMVNRIWQKIFGEGIVSTPNNWGLTGEEPSHPKLLDYLAIRFVDQGWSIKSLIREIVSSETYRRGSRYDDDNFQIDPENKSLWRYAPRQLDAEALRDAMLTVSGAIDFDRPNGSIVAKNAGRVGRQIDPANFELPPYRSVYLPLVRDMIPEALALFDFPDPSMPSAKRDETNMASQALYLMNNEFMVEQSEKMAARLLNRFDTREQQIRAAFYLAYARPITDRELKGCTTYLDRFQRQAEGSQKKENLAMEAFCQVLLSSSEFRILN